MKTRKFVLTFATTTGFHSVWLETNSLLSRELIEQTAIKAGLIPHNSSLVFSLELEE